MSDISFTEMGQALDAAAATRDTSTDVSSDTQPSASADGGPGDEGQSTPQDTPADDTAQPKADPSPVGDGVQNGKPSPATSGKPDDKATAERKKWNQWQAARRIAEKENKKRHFEDERKRLENERNQFADPNSQNHNPQMVAVKDDQLRELEIARVKEAQDEWERESYDLFSPEDAATFIADSKEYGDQVNDNEPELSQYITRTYGKHLLKGWFDKVAKNPAAFARWQSMNSFEKFRTLDKFYHELEDFGTKYAAGQIDITGKPTQQAPQPNAGTPNGGQQKPVNIPVPGSGRDTNTIPPSNNFALALQAAENRRRR